MALQKRDKISYLRVSDGKIRLKSVKEDKEAEERFVDIKKDYVYERVYTSCEGYLIDITVQTHDEYGTTYNLILFDPADGMKYSLGMAETSRYFSSFAQHMPNIDFSKPVTIKPYSFTMEGRTNIGVSVWQEGVKLENYYRAEFDEKSGTSKPRNGMEKFNFTKAKSKEDKKILSLQLLKWLKAEMKPYLVKLKEYWEKNPLPATDSTPDETDTDSSESEIVKGSRISAVIDGDEYEGEVKSIKGDKAMVHFDDGDKLNLSLDELTLLEPIDDEEKDLPY